MVRLSLMLARTPVIKFRKGGFGAQSAAAGASSAPGAGSGAASTAASGGSTAQHLQSAAAMSTSSIPDFELPLRYRRRPLSQEEIDKINGGGIV